MKCRPKATASASSFSTTSSEVFGSKPRAEIILPLKILRSCSVAMGAWPSAIHPYAHLRKQSGALALGLESGGGFQKLGSRANGDVPEEFLEIGPGAAGVFHRPDPEITGVRKTTGANDVGRGAEE
jgi:hypothetical protein